MSQTLKTPTVTVKPYEVDKQHVWKLAARDARKGAMSQGKNQFFDGVSPICDLCQCIVMNGHSKMRRMEHCKAATHTHNYIAYMTSYHMELQKVRNFRDRRKKEYHLCEARERLERIGKEVGVPGSMMDWYHVPGDQAGLKIALADLVFTRFLLSANTKASKKAVEKHVYYARAILCYRVAKSYLRERPGDAYTVGMLLAPYMY